MQLKVLLEDMKIALQNKKRIKIAIIATLLMVLSQPIAAKAKKEAPPYRKCEIIISGLSSTRSTTLLRQLEKSPLLEDIERVGPTYKDPATGKEVFTFKAKVKSNLCK